MSCIPGLGEAWLLSPVSQLTLYHPSKQMYAHWPIAAGVGLVNYVYPNASRVLDIEYQ